MKDKTVNVQDKVSPSINNVNVLEEDIVGDLLTTESKSNEKSEPFFKLLKEFISSIYWVIVSIINLVKGIFAKIFGFTIVYIENLSNKEAASVIRRKMIIASFDIVIFGAFIFFLCQLLLFTNKNNDPFISESGLMITVFFHFVFAFLISNINKAGVQLFLREDNKRLDYVAEFSFIKTNWNYQWVYLFLLVLLSFALLLHVDLPIELRVEKFATSGFLLLLIDQFGFIFLYMLLFAYIYMFRRFGTIFIGLGKYKKDEIPADISGRRPSFIPKILAGFITISINVFILMKFI